jgi:3-dehydroquinate synthase
VTARVEVGLRGREYPILIGAGLLSDASVLCGAIEAQDVLVVTSETVGPLYLERVRAGLAGKRVQALALPDGEVHKTLGTVARIFDAMVAARFNRDACIAALGGGVVGDMAGFAAACYQRGVDFVQLPTTLLAQVDASIGGKTGVNHPSGKNLIGAFHQPVAVIADTSTLATLPPREFRAGLAEVVKHALVADVAFLDWLDGHLDALLAQEPAAVAYAVQRSCEIKAQIVAADERERGRRAELNLGHTFGHAIETATGYGDWLHGEAVSVGMALAAALSQRHGWLTPADVGRVRDVLRRAGLPIAAPGIGAARALELMGMDKKVLGGRIRLVLLHGLGNAAVTADYDPDALAQTLSEYFGAGAA